MPRKDYQVDSVHFTCEKVKVKYTTPDGEKKSTYFKFQHIKILKDYVEEGKKLIRAFIRDVEEK